MSNASRKLHRRRKNQRPYTARWASRKAAIMASIMGVTPPPKPSKRTHAARLRQRQRATKRFTIVIEVMNQFNEPLKALRQTFAEHLRPAFEKLTTEVNEAFQIKTVDSVSTQA
jgi:biotin-(acetyl-CoA carboxylase) ligase